MKFSEIEFTLTKHLDLSWKPKIQNLDKISKFYCCTFVSFNYLELRVTLALCCHLFPSEGYIYISVLDSCSSDFIAAARVYRSYQA